MAKITTRIKNSLSKKSPFLKKRFKKMADKKNRSRYERYSNLQIENKTILFMSFVGKRYADSPRAMYEYMRNRDEYEGYKFVWAFVKPEKYLYLAENNDTILVRYHSDEHYKYYATAKFWFTNSRVPDIIPIRTEQVYVQCWHGTPLKRLGLDVEVKGANEKYSLSEINKKYKTDALKYSCMISPSSFCTDKFISAFGLDKVGRENIVLETGYPRNDFLVTYTPEDCEKIKRKLGIDSHKKIVLYAPTWRENQYTGIKGYGFEANLDFEWLKEQLGDEYAVLYRTHYFVTDKFDINDYKGFVYDVTDYDEINDLYIISDALITDYSSVFFDYANLERPIIFYMYDLEAYRDEIRGFYIQLSELPGAIVKTPEALVKEINEIKYWQINDNYRLFNKRFNPFNDGHSSERAVRSILEQAVDTATDK